MENNIPNQVTNSPIPPAQPVQNPYPPAPVTTPPVASPPPTPPNQINMKLVITLAAVFLVIIGSLIFYAVSKKPTSTQTGNSSPIAAKSLFGAMPDYKTDSDGDGYPDFVETENGLDPKVSEYDRCQKNGCGDAQLQQTNNKHNVLIILDDSGSMQLGGTPTRMEIAKQAIKTYISKASSNTQIGLMLYGHKGSNSDADKTVSCASAETVSPIGSVNSTSIDGLLANVKPVGWTPMGYALSQAKLAFTGKEGQNNEVIMLTDGEETCNSDPTGQATALKSSTLNIKINVIGFAVDSNAQTQLNLISSNGGGTFSTANNLTELDQRFGDLYENGLKLLSNMKCKGQSVDEFRNCYREPYQKITDWASKRKMTYFDKKISKAEYDALDNLGSNVFKQYMDVTSKATQQLNQEYNKTIQQIRGQ